MLVTLTCFGQLSVVFPKQNQREPDRLALVVSIFAHSSDGNPQSAESAFTE
jgi:hypothetical protein